MSQALPPSPPTIEVSVASQGVSKGIEQTDGPQAVLRAELPVGPIYFGVSAKNITSATANGKGGLTAGVRTKFAGLNLSASATWAIAISPVPGSDSQSLELAGSLARKFGNFKPQLSINWSPNDVGSTQRSLFYEASAAYSVSSKTSIGAAVGRRERIAGLDYTAFNMGITHKLIPCITADLRYYGSDKRNLGHKYQPGLIASVRVKL